MIFGKLKRSDYLKVVKFCASYVFLGLLHSSIVCSFHSNASVPTQSTLLSEASLIKPGDQCVLRFAWGEWAPYQYRDQQGQLVGTQIELIKTIAKNIGCQVLFKESMFEQTLIDLKQGNIDIIANATPTDARNQFALFSLAYAADYFVLVQNASRASQYNPLSLEQLLASGFRLGVTRQHYYGEAFKKIEQNPKVTKQLMVAESSYENYSLLLDDKIDGFLDNPLIAAFRIREKHLQNKMVRHPTIYYSQPICFMFSKKTISPQLVQAFNQQIQWLQLQPDYERRWNLRME